MMPTATLTRLEPLSVAISATNPVRAADLAARVALAGHHAVDLAEATLILADGDSRVAAGSASDLAVLRMGQGGTVPSDLSPIQLDAALRATAVGLRVSLAADLFMPETRPLLTPREMEILACLGEGLSNKAVARRLGISAHTVKFHLEAVFAKLGASSRADAVARGLRGGLILL